MSYLSLISKLYKNLRDALRLIHKACRLADRVDAEIQGSNASDVIKTASTAWHTATHNLCDALQAYKDALPGE